MMTLRTCCLIAFLLLLTSCTSQAPEPEPYRALDGDTIRVSGGPDIRLLGIDAPELPGHCRPGRRCQPGDPYLATAQLQTLLNLGELTCYDEGRDRYGRRLAECYIEPIRWQNGALSSRARPFNVSNAMLASGTVGVYTP